ncbi:hypothetical protein Q3G72_024628 [Acer saccharum]|nr:hypothetical protein Q3G72_024628 [Acer saccharum]
MSLALPVEAIAVGNRRKLELLRSRELVIMVRQRRLQSWGSLWVKKTGPFQSWARAGPGRQDNRPSPGWAHVAKTRARPGKAHQARQA